ncbi:hypothetical protein ABW20_dc0101386 [Dactylellina cionopaga]|nr:hypothetical protein ABW20_dc0101386 [Dactylellina cionopaga]
MARLRKDPAMQAPAALQAESDSTGDRQHQGDGHPTGEHRRTNAPAPMVPFQMVTRRRGAQQRTSGGSEDHAIHSEDLLSAKDEMDTASVPAIAGHGENEPELLEEEDSGAAPTAELDAGEAPRRSSRVVPKKVAPTVQKPSLIISLRLRPELLKQATEILPAEAPDRQVEDLEPITPRSKRPKQAIADEPAQPSSSFASAAGHLSGEESSVIVAQAETPAPSQKRARKTKEAVSYAEDPDSADQLVTPEEDRPPVEEAPAPQRSVEPVPQPVEPPTVSASKFVATPLPGNPSTPTIVLPMQIGDVPEEQTPLELQRTGTLTSEEPPQKRRGHPPKAEILRKQAQQQQQEALQQLQLQQLRLPRQTALISVAPLPPPADSLASQFRAVIPQGLKMLAVINIAKHLRDKDLKSKKRPINRLIKRGFSVEHQVTRDWCDQRGQRLVGQQRKLDRHLRGANLGLLDQTINLLQTSQEYLSATGPAAPLYNEGERVADEHRKKLVAIADYKLELNRKLAFDTAQANNYLSQRQYSNENLEKPAEQRAYLSQIVKTFAKEHPDELDAIIESCEESGEDVNATIFAAAFDNRTDIDTQSVKIWRGLGGGLGIPLRFSDDNDMDVEMEDDEEGYSAVCGGSSEPVALSEERGELERKEEEEPKSQANWAALIEIVDKEAETIRKEDEQRLPLTCL